MTRGAALVFALGMVLLPGPSHAASCQTAQVGAYVAGAPGGTGCFKSGEERSGANRICYYRCPTGTAAITVSVMQPCPATIRR